MEVEEATLEDSVLGAPVDEVEDKFRLFTRRAKRAPGAPFS